MDASLGLAGLVAFAFVSSVTPGPNNVLLWASGTRFGLRRSTPHVLGTALGIGGMALAVAAGLGTMLEVVPELATLMRIGGSIYLAWLAWRIARSGEVGQVDVHRPMGIVAAAAFQFANPKAWIFALGAVSTFRPADQPGFAGAIVVAVVMMLVIVPAAALWAGAGGVIGGLLRGPRARRATNLALAGLVLLTIATVWL